MSFNIKKAQRKTEFWRDNTPNIVAPGTYDPQNGEIAGYAFGRETSAPFNSVKERDVHDKVNNYPGPGFYNSNLKVNENRVSTANPNNSFTTKVARFAPIAPGSTAFKTASSFFNPGPGTYFKAGVFKGEENYRRRSHKSMVVAPKSIPPSIPMKKMPQNSYTGRGKDIPGPANYNPNVQSVKSKNRVADFSRQSKKREVFPNKTEGIPGPGNYDPRNDMQAKTASTFNTSGQSPMFLSKVPN